MTDKQKIHQKRSVNSLRILLTIHPSILKSLSYIYPSLTLTLTLTITLTIMLVLMRHFIHIQ